jgi:cytochrome c-type biogenesis protein CcmH/NrfG
MEIKTPVQVRKDSGESLNNFQRSMRQELGDSRIQNVPLESLGEKDASDKKLIVKILDKAVGLSIFAIFFGLPVFFTGLSFQGIIFEKQLYVYFWLLLGLVSWTAKGVILGEMNIRRTPLDIPIVGFWLVYLLATIFSVDKWHSFWGMFGDPSRGFMSVTALIIAYYMIFSNFNKKRLVLILTAILASGSLLTIWTLLAIRGIKFMPDAVAQYSPLSLVGSMSGLGIMFSCLVPIIAVVILKLAGNEDINKIFKKVIIGFLFAVLILDLLLISVLYNFVPWLGLFCGVALFLIFILAKIVRPKISWTWLPMVLFVVIMALKMTGEINIAKITLPVEVSPNYQVSWDIAAQSLKNKFILGSGPSTYGYDFSKNKPQDFNLNAFYNLRFFQGTGIVLEALPTIGGVGTFFLMIGMLSFLSLELYLLYREKERNKIYSLGIFAATVIIFIDFVSMRVEGTILIFGSFLAILSLATALYESGTEEKYLSLSLKASPKYALALAFLFMVVSAGVAFMFVFLGKIYAADIYAGVADRQIFLNQEDSITKMSKAIKLYGKESKYYGQLGQYYMILANKEAMKNEKERDLQKVTQYLNFSIAASRQSSDLTKNDVNSNEVLAQIYENAGLYAAESLGLAGDAYKRGLELEPHNPSYYLKLGQIKVNLASTKKDEQERKQLISEANDLFQKSVDEKANFDSGYYQLSLTQSALGALDKAIESATKAVQINPQNLDYAINLSRLYQARGKDDDIKTAEQIYMAIIAQGDGNISAHFYLGLLYEKEKNKNGAKQEYQKVNSLLIGENVQDTKRQIEKMISNVDKGIENTPENLGLTTSATDGGSNTGAQNQGTADGVAEEAFPAEQPAP